MPATVFGEAITDTRPPSSVWATIWVEAALEADSEPNYADHEHDNGSDARSIVRVFYLNPCGGGDPIGDPNDRLITLQHRHRHIPALPSSLELSIHGSRDCSVHQ